MSDIRVPPVSPSSATQGSNINPTLQEWIDNIEQWEGSNGVNNPGTNANGYAEEIAKFIRDYAQQNPSASPDQVLKLIQQNFFSNINANGHDVYFQSNAASAAEIQGLIAQFTGVSGKLSLPPPTTMDNLLMSYKAALHDTKISKQDNYLLMTFIREIGELGSNGKLSDLKSWAQDIINNPENPDHQSFENATSQVQELFEAFSINYKG